MDQSTRKQIPIACTLTADEATDRTGAWSAVLGRAEERVATEDGVRVRFERDPVLASTLAELAAREADCCGFFSFSLDVSHDAVWLGVSAPPDGRPILDALFGSR